jgi:hypothetical protein
VLRIDPATDTTALVGSSLGSDGYKWTGGVLSPQGVIYGLPYISDKVLRIDPATDTTALVGPSLGSEWGLDKWIGGVLSPQGMIYGIPSNSDKVLRIGNEPSCVTTCPVGTSFVQLADDNTTRICSSCPQEVSAGGGAERVPLVRARHVHQYWGKQLHLSLCIRQRAL